MVKVTALPVETFAALLCIVTVKPAGAPDCGVVVGAGVNVKAGMGVVVGGVTGVLLNVTKPFAAPYTVVVPLTSPMNVNVYEIDGLSCVVTTWVKVAVTVLAEPGASVGLDRGIASDTTTLSDRVTFAVKPVIVCVPGLVSAKVNDTGEPTTPVAELFPVATILPSAEVALGVGVIVAPGVTGVIVVGVPVVGVVGVLLTVTKPFAAPYTVVVPLISPLNVNVYEIDGLSCVVTTWVKVAVTVLAEPGASVTLDSDIASDTMTLSDRVTFAVKPVIACVPGLVNAKVNDTGEPTTLVAELFPVATMLPSADVALAVGVAVPDVTTNVGVALGATPPVMVIVPLTVVLTAVMPVALVHPLTEGHAATDSV